jgi:hypothetical protein
LHTDLQVKDGRIETIVGRLDGRRGEQVKAIRARDLLAALVSSFS